MKYTICACSSRTFIDSQLVARLAAAAKKAGHEVELVADLCELCENKSNAVHDIAGTVIAACHPRAVRNLMAFAGEDDCRSIDIRSGEPETDGIDMSDITDAKIAEWVEKINAMPNNLGKDAWFPTIDKSACLECRKCFEYCPFDVYEMEGDKVRVVNPHRCKNNCPSCARMCPAGAIVFPKYELSPINGGTEKQEKPIDPDSRKELLGKMLKHKLEMRKQGIKLTK